MEPFTSHAALVVSAFLLVSVEATAQTLEDVRGVAETFFGTDEQSKFAKDRLAEWENGALPYLRVLADEAGGENRWNVVCCISAIRTTEALDLLVDILNGETRTLPREALMALAPARFPGALKEHLGNHPRFKPAVRAIARGTAWLERGHAARIAVTMGWLDFAPLIEEMLEDENASLRATAADALSELLGRRIETDEPEPIFVDVHLIPGLVSDARTVEGSHADEISEAFLLPRNDGSLVLMLGDGRAFKAYPWTEGADELEFAVPALDVLVLRGGFQRQYVTLASDFGHARAAYAVSWGEDGSELWRYDPPRSGLRAAAILYGHDGPYGIAFGPGGDTGLVGVDADGEALWDVPRVHVLYGLATHPRLPGVLLVVGGQYSLASHSPKSIDSKSVTGAFIRTFRRGGDSLYAGEGVLYPGDGGAPEMIIAGSGANSSSVISCFDEEYTRKWKISLPHRVTQLAMLEVEGRERLFVVTTAGGKLFLVNQSGTLRWEGSLPGDRGRGPVHVFELVAGPCGAGDAMIALRCNAGFFLYTIRGHLLPLEAR